MGSAGPPKCKTCGIAEWRHTCSPPVRSVVGLRALLTPEQQERVRNYDGPETLAGKAPGKKAAPAVKASRARSKVVADTSVAQVPAVAVKASGRDPAPARPGTGMGEKAGGKAEAVGFDKAAYQRAYMRDKRAADKLGITVAEFRKLEGPTS